MQTTFAELGLMPIIVDCLSAFKYTIPSQIQALSIPSCLQGQDIMAQAQAGTGKTLCFLTTILQMAITQVHAEEFQKQLKIKANNDPNIIQSIQNVSPFSIVIVPTRELALQIVDQITRFAQKIIETYTDDISIDKEDRKLFFDLLHEVLQPKLFIGGLPIEQDRDVLKLKRCSIVIGTLGRIMQLLQENILTVHNVRLVVLDEADKLFENKSFQTSFKKIITHIIGRNNENTKPQMLTFSATYPENQYKLIASMMKNPHFITTLTQQTTLSLSNLEQFYYQLTDSHYPAKVNSIIGVLKSLQFKQAIVFYNDKNRGENLFNDLRAEGFTPIFIHGDQSQSDRIKIMHQMRRNKVNLIISTDLLSRGIDVDTLDIVLHFDKPSSTETYFHRIGRTGRYGTYGISLMFITEPNELEWVKPWVDDTSDINDRFKNKYTVPTSEKPYFAEFLNGVSNWKGKQYQFYDSTKFKYKEDEEPQPEERVLFKRQKQTKQEAKKDRVVKQVQIEEITSKHDDHIGGEAVNSILSCQHCKELAIQLQKSLGIEMKILAYFN